MIYTGVTARVYTILWSFSDIINIGIYLDTKPTTILGTITNGAVTPAL